MQFHMKTYFSRKNLFTVKNHFCRFLRKSSFLRDDLFFGFGEKLIFTVLVGKIVLRFWRKKFIFDFGWICFSDFGGKLGFSILAGKPFFLILGGKT